MPAMRNLVVPLLALLLAVACDSSKTDGKPSADDLAAKKAADSDADAKKVEERRKKREEEAAAKVKADE